MPQFYGMVLMHVMYNFTKVRNTRKKKWKHNQNGDKQLVNKILEHLQKQPKVTTTNKQFHHPFPPQQFCFRTTATWFCCCMPVSSWKLIDCKNRVYIKILSPTNASVYYAISTKTEQIHVPQ
uniref:Uncharacterized protein n=1 Tax=Arundo donax TaxID=35708 RepID=A0A0A9DFF3_ARUDO